MSDRQLVSVFLCLACVCVLMLGDSATAGGGPEATLLVANAQSSSSLAVANAYIRLRDLPESHVVWLDEVAVVDTIDVETFRKRILALIRLHLASTSLNEEIDVIAYSAGFPYAVSFRGDERARGLKSSKYRSDAASLTGMTFFARQVEAGQVGYLGRQSNQYFSRPVTWSEKVVAPVGAAGTDAAKLVISRAPRTFESARGFRSRYFWGRGLSEPRIYDADRYFLSTMLAYTDLRGNSLPEVFTYLARATGSDGTQPDGAVYLMENGDIRSRVRQHLFPAVIDELALQGRRAEMLATGVDGQNGREPIGKTDIVGLVAGTPVFQWETSESRLLPGAIAESFTSYGGHFANDSQTKLTEFLRHGAAGSSGAVREPYSFVEKFPVPQMHAYYAEGCSLAEAYYLSVLSPYQLLVVGDPLTRPFAHFAEVSLALPALDGVLRGTVSFMPRVAPAAGRSIKSMELWVDGRKLMEVPPGKAFALDTAPLADGVHELRVVAVEASAIETRSYGKRLIRSDNHGRRVEIDRAPETVRYGEKIVLSGRAAGAQRVLVRQLGRLLGETDVLGGAWRVELASEVLGMGPIKLNVLARYPDGGEARSEPVGFEVVTPALLAADVSRTDVAQGLIAQVEYLKKEPVSVELKGLVDRFTRVLGLRRAERATVSGAFEVRASGLYELKVEAAGKLALRVGDAWRSEVDVSPELGGVRLAVPLAAGWHRFELSVTNPQSDRLNVQLSGPEVAFMLEGDRVRRN